MTTSKTALAAALLASCVAGQQALAQGCPCGGGGTALSGSALGSLLGGKTVCASRGGDVWQEYMAASGDLIDYKRGPGDAVDPSEKVGTWLATAATPAVVTYNYGAGGSYPYQVCGDTASGPYRFCTGATATVTGATLLNGQVACSGGTPATLTRGTAPAR